MKKTALPLQAIAKLTNSTLIGDPKVIIKGVSDIENATEFDLSFVSHQSFEKYIEQSEAAALIITPDTTQTEGKNYLVNSNPSHAFNLVMQAIYEREYTGFESIHPSAIIHETAIVASDSTIGPNAVIDKNAKIGRSTISAGCYVGPDSQIGDECCLHPNVTIRESVTIKNRVTIGSGAVIGNCGYGFHTDNQGKHTRLPHIGSTIIEDDVEIGANTIIDHGRVRPTIIKSGTKINNLIQIGHGAQIGEDNMIVALTAVAGSVTTGRLVMIGGQSGVPPNLEITDNVMLAARSGVTKSITKPGKYGGFPAIPLTDHNRQAVIQKKLETTLKQIQQFEKRLAKLEKET